MERIIDKKYENSLVSGILSLIIWAFVPTISRLLSERIPVFVTGSITSCVGGLAVLLIRIKKGNISKINEISSRYWVLCGIPYFLYNLCSILAYGLTKDRETTILINLFTALWPLCTVVISIPVLKEKVTKGIYLSIILCLLGLSFATVTGFSISLGKMIMNNLSAILCAIISSVCWGIYSAYYCLIVHESKRDYQPVLQIINGNVMVIFAIINSDVSHLVFSPSTILMILFEIILSGMLANMLWGIAMRGKHRTSVMLLYNFSPVLSTSFTSFFLGTGIKWQVLIGSVLIAVSTYVGKKSIIT